MRKKKEEEALGGEEEERKRRKEGSERLIFKELAHAVLRSWPVQNQQGGPAGWRAAEKKSCSSSPRLITSTIPSSSGGQSFCSL